LKSYKNNNLTKGTVLHDSKLIEIGYFLSRRGKDAPPPELNVKTWKDAYLCFYEKLNNGMTKENFINNLKNFRDHFDSYLDNNRIGWLDKDGKPDKLPERYQAFYNILSKISDQELWEYLKGYANIGAKMNSKDLFWKFDVSTFRLLGRELITDRITALVELVKNSYDANAKNIYIQFIHTDNKEKGKIIICDDGFGMNADDIESKWMTIGTNSKRKRKFTPEPFNRRVVGEKGVGRFAIDKLGSHCRILTKQEKDNNINILTIDWQKYSDSHDTNNFQEITNKLQYKKFTNNKSGVKIVINHLHDMWTNYDIDRVYKEMSKIVSPFKALYPPFNIFISATQYEKYKDNTLVKNEAIKYASEKLLLDYDLDTDMQQIVAFENNELKVKEVPIFDFGPVKFQLYYFDQYAKGNFSKSYKGAELQIDGIKIYRDGILATPFAEHQGKQDNQRDILGIDKRRWSGFFDKVSSRDIIGILEIKKDLSPNIIDATNRQDFIDNQDYRDLKEFVITQIAELEKYLKYKKSKLYEKVNQDLEDAKNQLDNFSTDLKDFKNKLNKQQNVNIDQEIKKLENTARKANIALKQGLKQQENERKETDRKESMYMSLMSLQTYAMEITHIIKTSLSHIKQRAEFNLKYFNDFTQKDRIKKYNKSIMVEIDKLVTAIDFMSKYTRSDSNWEEFNIKNAFDSVFNAYQPILEKDKIDIIMDIQHNLTINYNIILFEDIITNLLNNSIKAVANTKKKKIKVTATAEDDALTILFSDNGIGIPQSERNKIFEVYHTTTSEEGGNGMGLYMIKTNINVAKGTIEAIDSELEHGATLKITLPFKR